MNTKLSQHVSVAFKEWSLICDALASGSQSLILRKGGIAEGRGGFDFEHESFWLLPTQFHTQRDLVLTESNQTGDSRYREKPLETGERFELDLMAVVIRKGRIDHWKQVEMLRDFHRWKEEVLQERFHYEAVEGLKFALLRVFKAENPLNLVMDRSFGGCRSWVTLPEQKDGPSSFVPVMSDEAFARVEKKFAEIPGIENQG